MDATELRAAQAPLKEQYRHHPESARTPLRATGRIASPGLTFDVDQFAGVSRAGLHRATGGDGSDACSGDMLLEALLACAGVTLHSVATAFGIHLRSVDGIAEGFFDARGTLGVDRAAPIGVQDLVLTFTVDTDADDATLSKLATATDRYCVVGQSLATPPTIRIRRP
ncbi:OsmC family protein [Nocardia huaxiensis]|uniref:OsmC family protein n=1 Tax=Nocardia huaxiensis TaxID=2755382 RepID=A0A7D6ZW36_9NOCA|nr:OsmC family protein [Nocardia huaxiensis]QLY30069.1 OsmC family protein [Nocardia huaxiensis]UFS96328.1 OsmC family protein [Nocardia huaxiensis]